MNFLTKYEIDGEEYSRELSFDTLADCESWLREYGFKNETVLSENYIFIPLNIPDYFDPEKADIEGLVAAIDSVVTEDPEISLEEQKRHIMNNREYLEAEIKESMVSS